LATDSSRSDLTPEDLLTAAALARQALAPGLEADWEVRAGTLDWTCRQTLDHIPNALLNYAGHLATRSGERRPPIRHTNPQAAAADLLQIVETTAAILAEVVRAAPPGARGFHQAGLADGTGFLAMGCTEILIHTADIADGLRLQYRPPDALVARVLQRLFPWAPEEGDPWTLLRWACGRAALPGRPQLDADWYWHCAPLEEWDGTVKKR
jgi:hypothetical protein